MTTLRPRSASLLVLPLVLVLTGCLKLDAGFVIKDENNIAISIDFGMKEAAAGGSTKEDMCETAKKTDAAKSLKNATYEPYAEEGYLGCRMAGTAKASELTEGFVIKKQDDGTWLFEVDKSVVEAGDQETNAGMFSTFRVTVTFPGKVLSHNGSSTVTATTVTWTEAKDLYDTGLKATGEDGDGSQASSAPDKDDKAPGKDETIFGVPKLWAYIGGGVLGVLLLLGLLAGLRRKK